MKNGMRVAEEFMFLAVNSVKTQNDFYPYVKTAAIHDGKRVPAPKASRKKRGK